MNYEDRTFPDPFPPDCATAWGDDRFGLWFDFEIGGVTQRMRWIEPGTFWMGSPETEPNRDADEGPRHLVTLTEGYWLADTACTQAFWKAVVGDAPSHFKADPELPVENVRWDDITEKFLPAVQQQVSDLTVALPTEAQWEYACRAARESAYWFGDTITKEQANFEAKVTVPVKARPANGWGLYQMHGNVWEWCEGSRRKYEEVPVGNPPDGQDQSFRALRGGSWDDEAGNARSAYRIGDRRGDRTRFIGFRFSLRSIKPDVVARCGLAEVLKAQGEYAQAHQHYEATMVEHPGDVVTRNGVAKVLTAQGDYAQALQLYEATMAQFPDDVVARNGLAVLLTAQGNHAQAFQLYEATMAQFPDDVVARNGLAALLAAQGNHAQAFQLYEATMAQFPDDVVARNGLAVLLTAQGDYAQALQLYEATMAQFPDDVVARNGLAALLAAQGDYVRARQLYEGTMVEHPSNMVARNGLAEVMKAQGDFAQARQLYEATMAMHPGSQAVSAAGPR